MTDHDPRPPDADHGSGEDSAAERWERRLATPALVAAFAAVPAVFLTLAEGTLGTTGRVIDVASAAVLVAEGLVPLAVSHDRWDWVKRHRWHLLLIAIIVPAVAAAAGPAQLLRLLRSVGALRVLRVRRFLRAGRVVTDRLGVTTRWRRVVVAVVSLAAGGFVAVALADPTTASGGLGRRLLERIGPAGAVIAGLLLAGATYLVMRGRGDEDEDGEEAAAEGEEA